MIDHWFSPPWVQPCRCLLGSDVQAVIAGAQRVRRLLVPLCWCPEVALCWCLSAGASLLPLTPPMTAGAPLLSLTLPYAPLLAAPLRVWREKQAREAASPQPPRALPLIVTTNTFMEASMEDEMLTEDSCCRGAGGRAALSSEGGKGGGAAGGAGAGGEGGWAVGAAVAANPFVSLEMLQSGTLGEGELRSGLHSGNLYSFR